MSEHGSPARSIKSPYRSPIRARKAGKVKKASSHPQYKEMIREALANLKEKNGSSLQKLLGYILANYNMTDASEAQVNNRLKFALRSGVKHGSIARSIDGVGVSGKFRMANGTLAANRKRRRSAKGKGKKRRTRRRRSPKRKTKRTRKTRRRRSPAKRRRQRRVARRRRSRKVKVTRRRRKVRSPRRRRRRPVVRRRRARR